VQEGGNVKRSPRRPSHATVVAYLALFIALSGTALAATEVETKNIENRAVTTKKLHNQAVTTKKLHDAAVTEAQLADGAVTTPKLFDEAVTQGKLQGDSVSSGKIQEGAVTPGKVTGPLGLAKVAAVVANINVDPLGNTISPGACDDIDVAVPGVQAGDSLLVLPRPTGAGEELFVVAGQFAPVNGQVQVWLCNPGGLTDVPPVQPVTIAAFR
jgi:hypothetical protein